MTQRTTLKLKFNRVGEGEAEGRYAIAALIVAFAIRTVPIAFAAAGSLSFAVKFLH
jgi:hypothetical protein